MAPSLEDDSQQADDRQQRPTLRVRWSDRSSVLRKALDQLELAPIEFHVLISEIFLETVSAYRTHQASEGLEEELSLSPKKLQGLLKSKQRSRWYDKDPVMHQAVNTLFLMPDSLQDAFGVSITVALKLLQNYYQQCERSQEWVDTQRMIDMTRLVFRSQKEMMLWQQKTGQTLDSPDSSSVAE